MTKLKFLSSYNILALLSAGGVLFFSAMGQFAHADGTHYINQDEAALRIGAGYYDITDDDDGAEIHAEYHAGYKIADHVRPFIGTMATSDKALYGYAGFRLEADITPKWQLAPSFAAGLYADGDGKDLGHTVNFRSAIEVNYLLQNKGRIGASLYHLSNSGLGVKNPGTEVVSMHYTHPIN